MIRTCTSCDNVIFNDSPARCAACEMRLYRVIDGNRRRWWQDSARPTIVWAAVVIDGWWNSHSPAMTRRVVHLLAGKRHESRIHAYIVRQLALGQRHANRIR